MPERRTGRDGARSGPGISASQPILPGLLRSPSRQKAYTRWTAHISDPEHFPVGLAGAPDRPRWGAQRPQDFSFAAHRGTRPLPHDGLQPISESAHFPAGFAPRWGAQRPQDFSFAVHIAGAAAQPIAARGRSHTMDCTPSQNQRISRWERPCAAMGREAAPDLGYTTQIARAAAQPIAAGPAPQQCRFQRMCKCSIAWIGVGFQIKGCNRGRGW